MKLKNIVLAAIGLVVTALAIGLSFSFNNDALVNNATVFGFYLATKIVYLVIFVGVVCYGVLGNPSRGTFYPLMVFSILYQGFAPLMRVYLNINAFTLGACMLTLLVPLLVLVLIVCGLLFASKKANAIEEKTAAKEIEVKEDLPDKF